VYLSTDPFLKIKFSFGPCSFGVYKCNSFFRMMHLRNLKASKNPRPGSKIPEYIHHLLRAEFH
jgi:hypothetical protein